MKLTGGQIVAEYLAREGVPYVLAIPGHGNVALLDAFVDRDDIRILPVVHEQCATHVADAYYRVTGKPLAVSTSIGPGAVNAVSARAVLRGLGRRPTHHGQRPHLHARARRPAGDRA